MLRNGLIALVAVAVLIGLFVLAENHIAPQFQTCIGQNAAGHRNQKTEQESPVIISIVRAQVVCSISLVDRHNGFFAALAGIAVAAFTFTLWIATDRLAKSGQTVFEATERAFVHLDGFNFETTLFTDTKGKIDFEGLPEWYKSHPELYITRFAIQPRWKNGGNTPTKKMTIQVDWSGPNRGPIPPPEYAFRQPPQPFFVAPNAVEDSEVIEVPEIALIVNWNLSPAGLEPIILIWGRADYEDVFGKQHFVEWCHRLRPSRTSGERMRVSTIQWGDYNRTDED